MASVHLRKVTKAWGDVVVSKDINLDINEGEFVVFVGPSGCGKSTLLRMIAGLETITSGDLLIGDTRMNDIPPAERGVGMVFQSYALYPHLSVAENMSFGLKLAVGMQQYLNPQNYLWGDFAAAAVLSAIPITVVFLLAQRWLVNGLTAGGVKG